MTGERRKKGWWIPFIIFQIACLPLGRAWAENTAPAVAQLPEDLRPLSNPEGLISDPPTLPPSEPLPCSSLGFCQTSLEFLNENRALSPANESFTETQPGITTGNLNDLIVDDLKPLVDPRPQIQFPPNPWEGPPLPNPPVNPDLFDEVPSLLTGEIVEVKTPSLPELEPVQEAEDKDRNHSYPGLGGVQIHLTVIKQEKPHEEEKEEKKEKTEPESPPSPPDPAFFKVPWAETARDPVKKEKLKEKNVEKRKQHERNRKRRDLKTLKFRHLSSSFEEASVD